MRRVLPILLLATLALNISIGCARQPQRHVGEWELINIEDGDTYAYSYIFAEDGKFQLITRRPDSSALREGTYKIDYSKNPIQYDIKWENGTTTYGILRYIGEDKMEIEWNPAGWERPTQFKDEAIGYKRALWTKKVKK